MKTIRRPHVIAVLLLVGVLLSEGLGGGTLGSLNWSGTRLVGVTDLGVARANLWLAGGVLPVVEFQPQSQTFVLTGPDADRQQ